MEKKIKHNERLTVCDRWLTAALLAPANWNHVAPKLDDSEKINVMTTWNDDVIVSQHTMGNSLAAHEHKSWTSHWPRTHFIIQMNIRATSGGQRESTSFKTCLLKSLETCHASEVEVSGCSCALTDLSQHEPKFRWNISNNYTVSNNKQVSWLTKDPDSIFSHGQSALTGPNVYKQSGGSCVFLH